jgi:hypothetical protein
VNIFYKQKFKKLFRPFLKFVKNFFCCGAIGSSAAIGCCGGAVILTGHIPHISDFEDDPETDRKADRQDPDGAKSVKSAVP